MLTNKLYSGFTIDNVNEVPDPFMIVTMRLLPVLLVINEIKNEPNTIHTTPLLQLEYVLVQIQFFDW